jgi:hypothetical protein
MDVFSRKIVGWSGVLPFSAGRAERGVGDYAPK